jgi:hypothetical protein
VASAHSHRLPERSGGHISQPPKVTGDLSTDQQINRSTDQQINRSTDQQINRSTDLARIMELIELRSQATADWVRGIETVSTLLD